MEETPRKKRRVEDIPVYYYALGEDVIPIVNLNPTRDLPGFRGAFVQDIHENPGVTEFEAFWVPPCLWSILLKAANPTVELVKYSAMLEVVSYKCRAIHVLTLIYDLRSSMNQEAGCYWTEFYDRVVDDICKEDVPSNRYLPFPETIVAIKRYIKNIGDEKERDEVQALYPELFRSPRNHTFPLWAMRDVTTATGGHKKQLTRILRLFNLLTTRPPVRTDWTNIDDETFEMWLDVYWKWRDYKYVPTEDGMYERMTDYIDYRHAVLHENTRKLFKKVYEAGSAYFFKNRYDNRSLSNTFVMVDPETAHVVNLATCENTWTTELVDFFRFKFAGAVVFPAKATQHALRQLPTASVYAFTRGPFFIHPIWTHLLNRRPTEKSSNPVIGADFRHIEGIPKSQLYWENLGVMDDKSITIYLHDCASVPDNVLDSSKLYACFDLRLLRVLRVTHFNHVGLLLFDSIQPGKYPLGENIDKKLRAKDGEGRYSIRKDNRFHWEFLVNTRAIDLFPLEVKKVSSRLK